MTDPRYRSTSYADHPLLLCRDCGATVADRQLHDAWHDVINGIAMTATKGDTANIFRPLW